jgi:hypothetical protein
MARNSGVRVSDDDFESAAATGTKKIANQAI